MASEKRRARGRPDLGRQADLRVRVTAKLKAQAVRAAHRDGVSLNELVIRALEGYLR